MERMRITIDVLWELLNPTGVSWIGFYVHEGEDELTLGPSRNKPACSPIGLHGACGRCFQSGRPLVVNDVKSLGANYVACDPRDQAEVIVPCFEADGRCWGVLDVDSFDVGAFSAEDALRLGDLLLQIGLTARTASPEQVESV